MDMHYQDLLTTRSAYNLYLHVAPIQTSNGLMVDDISPNMVVTAYQLSICLDGIVRTAHIDQSMGADFLNFQTQILPFANKAPNKSEVRFYTHDFADASTWHSKTCGDAAAPYVGGVAMHPLTGSWVDATGAYMLTCYDNVNDPHYKDPSYLYGSIAHTISAVYDDINYKWMAADGTTTLAWLDLSSTYGVNTSTAIWRDGKTNAAICEFDDTKGI
jgi:hypothetical protein